MSVDSLTDLQAFKGDSDTDCRHHWEYSDLGKRKGGIRNIFKEKEESEPEPPRPPSKGIVLGQTLAFAIAGTVMLGVATLMGDVSMALEGETTTLPMATMLAVVVLVWFVWLRQIVWPAIKWYRWGWSQ